MCAHSEKVGNVFTDHPGALFALKVFYWPRQPRCCENLQRKSVCVKRSFLKLETHCHSLSFQLSCTEKSKNKHLNVDFTKVCEDGCETSWRREYSVTERIYKKELGISLNPADLRDINHCESNLVPRVYSAFKMAAEPSWKGSRPWERGCCERFGMRTFRTFALVHSLWLGGTLPPMQHQSFFKK